MSKEKKLALAGILVALAVVCSPLSIPIGASRCFPVQHMVNVLGGVILGPLYACAMAFITSLIRVLLGTGTILAFPGSMVGALCCGLLYRRLRRLSLAYVGEVCGTGLLGALLAYPMAYFLMGNKEAALFGYVMPFMVSTVVGAAIAVAVIKALEKTGVLGAAFRKK